MTPFRRLTRKVELTQVMSGTCVLLERARRIRTPSLLIRSLGPVISGEAPDRDTNRGSAHTDRLPFPGEWTAEFDALSGGEAERKLLVVRKTQRHYREHNLGEPLALDRQARQAREVEDQMSRGVDVTAARLHGWLRLAVTG